MKTYKFTLVLSGISDFDDSLVDKIFEVGCDDASLLARNGIVYLDFDREDESFNNAIRSAIKQLETIIEPNIQIDSIKSKDLSSILENCSSYSLKTKV